MVYGVSPLELGRESMKKMDKHTVTMHTVTMRLSDRAEPVNSHRYDAESPTNPIVTTL